MPDPDRSRPVRSRVLAALAAIAAIAVALPGCRSQPAKPPAEKLTVIGNDQVNPVHLQADVNAFAFTFRSQISGAASEMARATTDRAVRESTVRWKVQVIPAIDAARRASDPRAALAGVWAICVRQRSLFEGEFGVQCFGDQVETARRLAADLEKQVIELAGRYLPPERVAEIGVAMERLAADAPIIAGFDIPITGRSKDGAPSSSDPISQVLSLPMMPFSAVGALGDTPAEIRNIANVAETFSETTRDMPEHMRWQMELFILETEDHPAFKSADRISLAAESIASTAANLQASIDRADGPVHTVHLAVQDARALVDQVDVTAARAERVVASIDGHAAALSQTAGAFESTVHAVQDLLDTWLKANPPKPPPAPGAPTPPEAPPFDIKDAVAVADETRAAIVEARGLLSDLQTTTLKDRLAEVNAATKISIDHAAARLDAAISRLVWSLAAVVVLAIIASAIVRVAVYRFTRTAA